MVFRRVTNQSFLLVAVVALVFGSRSFSTVDARKKRGSRRAQDAEKNDWPPVLEEGTYCKSQGEQKFDPVLPVFKAKKAPKETTMSFCTQFKHNTCCNRSHTDWALIRSRQAAAARVNPTCKQMIEVVSCSHCHADVGRKLIQGVCRPLCDAWFNACREEFFSSSGLSKLRPCMDSALLCSRLDDIVTDGDGLCKKMGYEVVNVESTEDGGRKKCYDGSAPGTYGAKDPTAIKSVFERYETGYDQKYSVYVFSTAWAVLALALGTFLWKKFVSSEDDDYFDNDDDFFSPPPKHMQKKEE
eukprot:g7674.t1